MYTNSIQITPPPHHHTHTHCGGPSEGMKVGAKTEGSEESDMTRALVFLTKPFL